MAKVRGSEKMRKRILAVAAKLTRKNLGRFPTDWEMKRAGVTPHQRRWHFGSFAGVEKALRAEFPKEFKGVPPRESGRQTDGTVRKQVLATIAGLVRKKRGRFPSNSELQRIGVTREQRRYHFGTMEALEDELRAAYPKLFFDVPLRAVIQDVDLRSFTKRIILTTAVVGCEVSKPFLKALESYCDKREGQILLLVCADPAAEVSRGGWGAIDAAFKKSPHVKVIGRDTAIHPHLMARTIKTSAKQLDPTWGLTRVGRRGGSYVYASPKQRLEFVPASSPAKLPHVVMTTGAVTLPAYQSDLYMSQRLAYLANWDHVMGAVVVELDEGRYHFRQLQSDAAGSFADLGQRYHADGRVTPEKPAALVCGDTHVGVMDPDDERARLNLVAILRPEIVVLHDLFNGKSISHHELKKSITRAQQTADLPLGEELDAVANYLKAWSQLSQVVVVKSNHDEWLDRYVEECRFSTEPRNYGQGLDLAMALYGGKDPLAHAMEARGVKGVRFLSRRDSLKIKGVELSQHGDKGPNGTRASLRNLEQAYGNCVVGHAHTPAILRGVYRVGTSSRFDLHWNVGPSSWFHTHCLVYADGSRQLVNTIQGSWRLK